MTQSSRGNRIRELREAEGLSMDQLGARCIPPATGSQINKLEKGGTQLTQDWIYRIADALSVHALEILEPIPKLTPQELALVTRYRELAEPDQQAVYRITDAMAQADIKKNTER